MATATHADEIRAQIPHQKSLIGFYRPDNHKGLFDWLTTVDHKKIGVLYGAFALFFFVLGGIEALMIRTQLLFGNDPAAPDRWQFVTAQTYNQLFTMHGTTMIFLAVMPLSAAFFNFVMPLQIGARDVAFPRLNAFSLWTFVAGAFVLNVSWLFQFALYAGWMDPAVADGVDHLKRAMNDIAPGGSWVGYPPISSKEYSGIGTDFWIMGLQLLGVASIAASLNFIVTIINMRSPGMKMMRLPVFTWMTLVTSFLIVLSFPAITIALVELMFDRHFGTGFFRVELGGQPILWQHLFWIFGHPEVYILILPGLGLISEILPTFAKKPLFGYPIIVFSGAVIGFLGFAVWSHHMFTTDLGKIATAAFSLLTMAIAVPTGVKIFNWIGTLWHGRIRFTTAMIFACGFVWNFMCGGLSGIMHSAAPADHQQHESYFVIAHFHYVLIGGAVLALIAGIYYYFPKVFGKMLNEKLGRRVVAPLIIGGANLTFFPMHFLGLNGMLRRTHTYLKEYDIEKWNQICTVGAFLLAFGVLFFVLDMILSVVKKGWAETAPSDPWDARTIEWSTPTPIPVYNYATLPVVKGVDAFWISKYGRPDQKIEAAPEHGDHGIHMPSQSWWPLLCGFGFFLMGTCFALSSAKNFVMFGHNLNQFVLVGSAVGLGLAVLGIILWALEGPGGYHLHIHQTADHGKKSPKDSAATAAH